MLRMYAARLALLLLSQTAWSHSFEIDTVSVPGACVISDYMNRSFMPWQSQKPNIIIRDGVQKRFVLVLPSKIEEMQSASETEALQRCVVLNARTMSLQDLERVNTEDEKNLTRRINACLNDLKIRVDVRFATIKRESIQCPEGTSLR